MKNVRARTDSRATYLVALLVMAIGTIAYHYAYIVNTEADADAAVVGLQARHMLHGEFSWFIWAAGYQGSLEAVIAAVFFAVFGSSSAALLAANFAGTLLQGLCVYAILARRVRPLVAVPLVWLAVCHTFAVIIPREWAITLVFIGLWLIDRASAAQPKAGREWVGLAQFAGGMALVAVAPYVDLFAIILLPAAVILALLTSLDGKPDQSLLMRRLMAVACGLAVGFSLFVLSHVLGPSVGNKTDYSFAQVSKNWPLFWDVCLPMLLSLKVFVFHGGLYPDEWVAPPAIWLIQRAGACLLVSAMAFALFRALRKPARLGTKDWLTWRLAVFAAIVLACTIGGFLLSTNPVDMWATRYLAPLLWVAPFALLPLASIVTPGRIALLLFPFLLSQSITRWLTHNPIPPEEAATRKADEQALRDYLLAQDVHYAAAQYWVSYRLTLIYREDPIVIPLWGDRYQPYRVGFARAPKIALLFDKKEVRDVPQPHLNRLAAQGVPYQVAQFGDYTAIVYSGGPRRDGTY